MAFVEFIAPIIAIIIGLGIGFFIGAVFHKRQLSSTFAQAQEESKVLLEEAHREADQLLRQARKEAKEEARKRQQRFEEEIRQRRQEITKLEAKIKQREQALDKKLDIIEKKEREIYELENQLKNEEQRYKRLTLECEKTLEQSRRTLQNIARMSPEEAKAQLIASLEEEARKEAAQKLREIEQAAQLEAEEKARSMVSLAVQRISSEFVNESTVSVVSIPSDEMKGRIIGREGRNIRALENATGVDLIIDDTPEAVILSSFNPIRREVAKIALSRLVADGRIHPARIEETVKRVEEEFAQTLVENGEQACFETGITDLHPELTKRLGKLRYRATGTQTVLQHSIEVAHICGIMAGEMGLNIKRAKRAGLLHDIGKSVSHEVEGHHAKIGAELCAKYGEADEIVTAIREHHATDVTHLSPLGLVVHAANSLSANRPGARRELLESYIKRLEDMEELVTKFKGIEKAFVMQAGREIRAMVTPSGITDEEIIELSQNIASTLRREMTFPGQVRVTVVRESKVIDYAR